MRRRLPFVLWVALALAGCGANDGDGTARVEGGGPGPGATGAPSVPEALPPEVLEDRARVTLYFAGASGDLDTERREILWDGTDRERARRVLEALIEGPQGRLTPVIPSGTTLLAVYLEPNGTAYIDFDGAFERGLPGGSEDALLALRAVTDTLAGAMPGVRAVKILIDGKERTDLGGHLDLSRPLRPDPGVAGAPAVALDGIP